MASHLQAAQAGMHFRLHRQTAWAFIFWKQTRGAGGNLHFLRPSNINSALDMEGRRAERAGLVHGQ